MLGGCFNLPKIFCIVDWRTMGWKHVKVALLYLFCICIFVYIYIYINRPVFPNENSLNVKEKNDMALEAKFLSIYQPTEKPAS